jgi:hypothetical protein
LSKPSTGCLICDPTLDKSGSNPGTVPDLLYTLYERAVARGGVIDAAQASPSKHLLVPSENGATNQAPAAPSQNVLVRMP